MKTIIMTNFQNDYFNTDYRKKYNINYNEMRVQVWYNESDLMDLVKIAMCQIETCDTIIIEK